MMTQGVAQIKEGVMGKVAYATQGVIYVADLEADIVQRFDQGQAMWNPAWSPDGRTIAYGWGTIHLLDVQTGDIHDLVQGGAFPDFHPDGQTLIYSVNGRGLYAHHLPTDNITKIIGNALQPFQPVWHPQGDRIAFIGQVEQNRYLYTLDLNCMDEGDCEAAVFSVVADGRYNHAPAWSPDGEWLAFERLEADGANWGVMLVKADGSALRRVSPPDVRDHHPTWTTDGANLVVEREQADGGANLYLINLEGQVIRQLTTDGGKEPDYIG